MIGSTGLKSNLCIPARLNMTENLIVKNNTQTIFLIPNYLHESNPHSFLPDWVKLSVHHLQHFIVETEKDARALLKKLQLSAPQSDFIILNWNEHSKPEEIKEIEKMLASGVDIGIISDAGLPCIADPGAEIVRLAHQRGIKVKPLPGASSIFMALMGSGFNGQSFIFHGYLPIDKIERSKKIKQMELDARKSGITQIFMETPYRNLKLLDDLVQFLAPDTKICIAANISAADELIKTATIAYWKKELPAIHKQPAIFIIGK